MIRHTKLTKSNVPALVKPARKKISKKILSSCGTPRKVFSKSTSRNGSPFPVSTSTKRLTISKIKSSANSSKITMDLLNSCASPNSSAKTKKYPKSRTSKILSGNVSPKDLDYPTSFTLKDSVDIKEKSIKCKTEGEKQMKNMLQKLLSENVSMKNRLKLFSESQEEPKSTMNTNSLELAMEEIKRKLRSLKKKFT